MTTGLANRAVAVRGVRMVMMGVAPVMVVVMVVPRPPLRPQANHPAPHEPQPNPSHHQRAQGGHHLFGQPFRLAAAKPQQSHHRINQPHRHRSLRQRRGQRDPGKPPKGHPPRHAIAADHQLAMARPGGVQKPIGKAHRQQAQNRPRLPAFDRPHRPRKRVLHLPLLLQHPRLQGAKPAQQPHKPQTQSQRRPRHHHRTRHVTHHS